MSHGLAGSIRAATESETFDLGGLGPETIQTAIEDAMTEPFSLSEGMIRITLVVGAGKQSRQKYNAGAMKVVTSTLQNKCGFIEDRGASCVLECQGMYKVQHDTGKNLKTVVVFPKIVYSKSGNVAASYSNNGAEDDDSSIFFPKASMEYKVASSSLNVFRNIVQAKCPSWSQKKALLQLIDQDIVGKIISPVDDMLMRGQRVPENLQNIYDNVVVEISEKEQYVKDAMHNQVDAGILTQSEMDHLLEQVQHRIENSSSSSSTSKLKERIKKLKSITPIPLPKLKHHSELGKLWKQVNNIQIPDTAGRLLSVQESKLVAKRDELLDEIEHLEDASRGWLEEADIYEMRLNQCRSEFGKAFSNKANTKKGGKQNSTMIGASTKTRVPITKWVLPGETKAQGASKKKTKMQKGDLFGAMMAASSSEEEEDEEDEVTEARTSKHQNTTEEQQVAKPTGKNGPQQGNVGAKTKRNKKKGKRNNKQKAAIEGDDTPAVSTHQDLQESQSLPMAIITLFLAILGWFFSLIFGTGKPKKQKKK